MVAALQDPRNFETKREHTASADGSLDLAVILERFPMRRDDLRLSDLALSFIEGTAAVSVG